jgi:uncharacterized protein YjbI with pentapeptide repeats
MNRKISSAQTRRSPDLPENLETLLPVDVKHLEGQTIRDSRGFGIDISGQHFSSLRFVTCLLERMSFANCTIGSCRFRDVRLEKCDLSNAVLRGSEATRIELVDCRLTGLKAIECRWRDVLIENCDVRYTQCTDGAVIVSEFKTSQFLDADFRNTKVARNSNQLFGSLGNGAPAERARKFDLICL